MRIVNVQVHRTKVVITVTCGEETVVIEVPI